MSTVHPFPVPQLLWIDWLVVASGLGVGVGACFEMILLTLPKGHGNNLFTLQNVWLILSGVIHVQLQ